ncbi:hypothetical protein CYMTET_54082 [Cymbomonas tetramitiformis]|uniref:Heme oxygenase n=1 Tax=Cymbomonas tetramitiformis TaxID=36881 RepID=A0AAE0BFP4_9CHLO|nr:hypothetical protein CYMTET_54082 [Cymbomonas tetramitiformis]
MDLSFLCPVGSVRKKASGKTANEKPKSADAPLSVALKEATADAHSRSDNLIQAKSGLAFADKQVWGGLVCQFGLMYGTLEEELRRNSSKPHLAPLYEPFLAKLRRWDAFQKDVEYFLGTAPGTVGVPCSATEAYQQRIRHVSAESPFLLVAYAQTMYMALLSGGQILRRMSKAAMLLPDGQGGAIFEFEEIPTKTHRDFKLRFAAALDALPIDASMKEQLIAEKQSIFPRNDAIVMEVVREAPLSAYFSLVWPMLHASRYIALVGFIGIVAFGLAGGPSQAASSVQDLLVEWDEIS